MVKKLWQLMKWFTYRILLGYHWLLTLQHGILPWKLSQESATILAMWCINLWFILPLNYKLNVFFFYIIRNARTAQVLNKFWPTWRHYEGNKSPSEQKNFLIKKFLINQIWHHLINEEECLALSFLIQILFNSFLFFNVLIIFMFLVRWNIYFYIFCL